MNTTVSTVWRELRRLREPQGWKYAILGLGVGLYTSRLVAETGNAPRPWFLAVGMGLVFALAASLLLRAVRHINSYPLVICYAYVLYPVASPSLALASGLMALFGVVIASGRTTEGVWLEATISAAGMAIYIATLAPGLLPADSGEFQIVSALLGIAHPPGYPLYTLLGRAFTLVPLADVAYRVNLLSAVIGALTLGVVAWTVGQLTPNPWPRLAAALALGGATTFWAQATTANVRMLTALFTALILALTLSYGRQRAARKLTLLGLLFGLAIAHHASVGVLTFPVGAYLISVDSTIVRRPHQLLRPLAAAILSLGVLLYLPIRDAAGAVMSPGDLTTLGGFTEHVMAEGFQGDMFALARFTLLAERLALLRDILLMQFGSYQLVAILLGGIVFLWRGRRKAFLLIGGVALLNGFVGLTYRAPQTVEYLMPIYVCLALMLGGGLGALVSGPSLGLRSNYVAVLLAFSLYLATDQLLIHYSSFAKLHSDRSTRSYAQEVLQSAPPRATILSSWHHFTPLRYLQLVEGQRLDVTIRYVYPRGSTSQPDLWLAQIDRYIQGGDSLGGPVIVTNLYPQFEASVHRFRPLAGAFLVVEPPERTGGEVSGEATKELAGSIELDRALAGALGEASQSYSALHAVVGAEVELMAYRLEGKIIEVQRPLELLLAWRPLVELEQDVSFFVHLVGADGTPLAQADTRHVAGRHRPGEVWVDRYTLYLRPTVSPGTYRLVVGAYRPLAGGGWERLTTPMGTDHLSLGEIDARPSTWAPTTLHPQYFPFSEGIALVGVDYEDSHATGRRVYLHWRLTGPTPPTQVALLAAGQLQGQVLLAGNSSGRGYVSTAHDISAEASSLQIELRQAENGARLAPLGAWHVPSGGSVGLPPPKPDDRYVSLGGEMALVGAHIEGRSTLTVRLQILASGPLTHDYTFSVRLRGADGEWETQVDGTPAGGAIPTLKWIRGTKLGDVRRLSLPRNATEGQARLDLLVYDAFTMATLPPLDERLLARGPLIPLGETSIPDSAVQ